MELTTGKFVRIISATVRFVQLFKSSAFPTTELVHPRPQVRDSDAHLKGCTQPTYDIVSTDVHKSP